MDRAIDIASNMLNWFRLMQRIADAIEVSQVLWQLVERGIGCTGMATSQTVEQFNNCPPCSVMLNEKVMSKGIKCTECYRMALFGLVGPGSQSWMQGLL